MSVKLPNSTRVLGSTRFLVPAFLIVGTVGLLLSLLVENPFAFLYPSALLGGVFAYLIFRDTTTELPHVSKHGTKALLLCYVLVLGAIPQLYLMGGGERTPLVLASTFLLYGVVATGILLDIDATLGGVLIVIAGIVQRTTGYYSSSLYVGQDIYGHVRRTSGIMSSGQLSGIGPTKYFYSPFYHILVGWSSLLMGGSLKNTIFLVISTAVTVIPIIVIYFIGRESIGSRAGLMASLLYCAGDFSVGWGIHLIPTSLGVVFFSIALLAAMKYEGILGRGAPDRYLFLFTLFLLFVGLTHQLSLFVTFFIVVSTYTARSLYESEISRSIFNIILTSGVVVYVNFVITRFGGPSGESSFFDFVLGNLVGSIVETETTTRLKSPLPDDPSISAVGSEGLGLVHVLGSGLLLLFGITGAMIWLERDRNVTGSNEAFVLGGAAGIPLIVTLAGPIFSIRNILPFRWFVFIYVPLSLLAGYGVISGIGGIVGRFERGHITLVVVVVILLLTPYFTLMGGNFIAAKDGALFDESPGAERLSTTETERALYTHVADHGADSKVIRSDVRARSPLRHLGAQSRTLYIRYGEPNSLPGGSYIVNRRYLRTEHAQYRIVYSESVYRVYGAFPVDEIADRRVSKTYDTGKDDLLLISRDPA